MKADEKNPGQAMSKPVEDDSVFHRNKPERNQLRCDRAQHPPWVRQAHSAADLVQCCLATDDEHSGKDRNYHQSEKALMQAGNCADPFKVWHITSCVGAASRHEP